MKTIIFTLANVLFLVLQLSGYSQSVSISASEKEGILLMREEEKLAHDVYTLLYDKWQLQPFSNISGSESRHFDAMGYLLETFELNDPAFPEAGRFKNRELAVLYDSLVSRGSESLLAALEVGAYIEEVDILDLKELIETSSNDAIAAVYSNLLRGSENHIRAFTRQLSWRDLEYVPTVLDAEIYSAIVGTSIQCGNRGNCINATPHSNNCKQQGGKQFRNRGKQNGCWNN
ncbi:DUF2202 domain-containing protein [Maribellus sp. YY47]|uniref:DUF2202 domain-containing protein n=1 Tax=Maribellus sp. YY47 TaxID=2929486 RepID=UPI0020015FC6|nr:DUF2202 domain-containing protein [Maribellus sp. YY47]MCK3683650.1 DUF2202 domain-containing protein [Maribellus sp. YY47]